MQTGWIIVFNIFTPGAGLIVLRRARLGFCTAMLFCVLAQIALVGRLLLPATVPSWISSGAAVWAAFVWLWAQWMTLQRLRSIRSGAIARELALLIRRVDESIVADRLADANDLIDAALLVDDESPALHRRRAEMLTRLGDRARAVRAWRQVLQLERDPNSRREAAEALAALQSI